MEKGIQVNPNFGNKRKFSQYSKTTTNVSSVKNLCKDRTELFEDNLKIRKRITNKNLNSNNLISFEEAKLNFECEKENRKPHSYLNNNKNSNPTTISINALSSQMNKLEIRQFQGTSSSPFYHSNSCSNFNPFTMKPVLKKNFSLSDLNTEVRSNFKKSFGKIIHQNINQNLNHNQNHNHNQIKYNNLEANKKTEKGKITGKRNFLFLTDKSISNENLEYCENGNNLLNFTPKFREKTPDKEKLNVAQFERSEKNMDPDIGSTILYKNLNVNILKTNLQKIKKDA